jgi:hypothetical protein
MSRAELIPKEKFEKVKAKMEEMLANQTEESRNWVVKRDAIYEANPVLAVEGDIISREHLLAILIQDASWSGWEDLDARVKMHTAKVEALMKEPEPTQS